MNLETARFRRIGAGQVVDDQRRPRILANVPAFQGPFQRDAANVEMLAVELQSYRGDVRLVVGRRRRDARETLSFPTAVPAPDLHAAAQYYPAGYWFSLVRVPDEGEFPGTGDEGNGIRPRMRSQAEWLRNLKSGGCWACHQMGNKATREIPKELGSFASSEEAGIGASSRDRPVGK